MSTTLRIRRIQAVIWLIAFSASIFTFAGFNRIAFAVGESVTVPEDIELQIGQNNIQLADSFNISGFLESTNLLTSISFSGETTASFSVMETSGLTLEFGYQSWIDVSSVSFTGTQADTNNALDSIVVSSGDTEGIATLSISVQEKVSGTAYFSGNGHIYEFVPNWDITYMDARTEAGLRTLNGLSGYLATVTSQEEHNFVLTKIQDAQNIWIALSDREVEGTWVLDPKDGHPEQGTVVWTGLWDGVTEPGQYAAWCGGEPNDAGGEDAAVTLWYGGNCWNDLPHDTYPWVGGYVVEYEPTQIANPIFTDSMDITISPVPITTTTTTTTPSTTTTVSPTFSGGGCGPYQQITVTGKTNGSSVWGSNPYTDDSDFSVAAVHAGLISVGETAIIEPYWVDNYLFYGASIANGVTTSEWDSEWCGYYIKLAGTPTPTTSTTTTTVTPTTATTSTTTTVYVPTQTTTTTAVPPTTTTTQPFPSVTTTTEAPVPPTTTVPETTTTLPQTTTVPETTTTVPETTVPVTTVPPTVPATTLPDVPVTPSTTTPTTSVPAMPVEEEKTPDNPLPETVTEAEVVKALDGLNEADKADKVAAIVEELTTTKEVKQLTEEDKKEIASVVAAVIQSGITAEIATTLAASPAVLESVDTTQAVQIFEQVNTEQLTEEAAAEVVNAVQEAPSEIREVFEEVVSLFSGAFDSYKMLGSNIDVGQRRTVVAASLLTSASAAAAFTGASFPSSGGSSHSSPTTRQDTATRRENEEESETAGEIAGDGLDWIRNISIYKYVNGVKVMNWKAFIKKFVYGLLNMGFTIAGSLVVYLTLSGTIQKIAGISTVIAIAAAMYLHMKEPEEG